MLPYSLPFMLALSLSPFLPYCLSHLQTYCYKDVHAGQAFKATRAPTRRNPKAVHLKSSAQIQKHNSKWIKDLNLIGTTSRREHKEQAL